MAGGGRIRTKVEIQPGAAIGVEARHAHPESCRGALERDGRAFGVGHSKAGIAEDVRRKGDRDRQHHRLNRGFCLGGKIERSNIGPLGVKKRLRGPAILGAAVLWPAIGGPPVARPGVKRWLGRGFGRWLGRRLRSPLGAHVSRSTQAVETSTRARAIDVVITALRWRRAFASDDGRGRPYRDE